VYCLILADDWFVATYGEPIGAQDSLFGVVVIDHSRDESLRREVHVTADIRQGVDIADEWDEVPFVAARRLAAAVVNTAPFAGSSAVVAVSECATVVDPNSVSNLRMAVLYGTNIHQGLVYARSRNPKRIVVIAYSAPTAHWMGPDDRQCLFSWPPTLETLERTKREFDGAVNDGVRIDAVLIDDPGRGDTYSAWTGSLHEINDLVTDATFRSHGLLAHVDTPVSDMVIADIVHALTTTSLQ
jgi:hypothetical protein